MKRNIVIALTGIFFLTATAAVYAGTVGNPISPDLPKGAKGLFSLKKDKNITFNPGSCWQALI